MEHEVAHTLGVSHQAPALDTRQMCLASSYSQQEEGLATP